MKNIKIPENISGLLDEFVKTFQDILGDNLVGIYLHGSLAMGSYNPVSSDIDLLVVVKGKLNANTKKEIGEIMIRLQEKAPQKPSNGFEISVITLDALQNFTHPTPYELHFSSSNKEDFVSGKIDFEKENTDPDLAAHLVITKERGVCLYGEPIEKVFPDIPKELYLQSIIHDTKWSLNNVAKGQESGECAVPVYAVLNFCRVLAFLDDKLITSKLEGGEWGLKNLPEEYHPIIQEALNEYKKSGSAKPVNATLLKKLGKYIEEKINKK